MRSRRRARLERYRRPASRAAVPGLFGAWPEAIRDGLEQRSYRDTHRWQFTPTSFRLLISDLALLGYHGLGTVAAEGPDGFEFFVTLGKGTPIATERSRLEELLQIEYELAETTTAVVQSELAAYRQAKGSGTQNSPARARSSRVYAPPSTASTS